MKIEENDEDIIIKGIKNFNPVHTFECGQCFRWNKTDEDTYIGVAKGMVLELALRNNDLYIYNISLKEFYEEWQEYFDLSRDYGKIQEILGQDPLLKKAIDFGKGIRILNQDPWESLISFIISANKNIPHIKIIIEYLSKNYGDRLVYKGKDYYTFPRPKQLSGLSIEEISQSKCGYRAKFIHSAIDKVESGEIDLDYIKSLPSHRAREGLVSLYGVGPKIADCVMLFSMGKYEVFPTDVWIKRLIEFFYLEESTSIKDIRNFANRKWGNLAGFAQQYLFYYGRSHGEIFK